ncbi:hypothetical protein WOLCODRAFT_155690 [Wolfiporia cocos MD-104 SS10]|uniref:Uncharacterized protein n=1 Tax=Wolfiporia cocos (strain MD-104) TaxID=742152 RepID=A0A2H3IYK0_WOLCO|nr:hypothetical protein WOLCODRAFT_155690 [Wolfiporia cocos MD-104 SS10]
MFELKKNAQDDGIQVPPQRLELARLGVKPIIKSSVVIRDEALRAISMIPVVDGQHASALCALLRFCLRGAPVRCLRITSIRWSDPPHLTITASAT